MRKNIAIVIFCLLGTMFPSQGQIPYGVEFQVNTDTNIYQDRPKIATLSDGGFVICWEGVSQDGRSQDIYFQLFSLTGEKIGEETKANTFTEGQRFYPQIAALLDGKFTICWVSKDQDGSDWGVYFQIFSKTGEKEGNELRANSYVIGKQWGHSIASLMNGTFVITWWSEGQDGSGYGVYGQVFSSIGEKIGNEFRINTHTDGDQLHSQIITLSENGFVVCWLSWEVENANPEVYAQLFSISGEKVGPEFKVDTSTPYYQWGLRIVALAAGGFAICWVRAEQIEIDYKTVWGIYGQIFSANGDKIGNEFKINTFTNSVQWYPDIAALSTGDFVICWESQLDNGVYGHLYGQLFSATGEKLGNEFQITAETHGGPKNPKIASQSSGKFLICWIGQLPFELRERVFGQLFSEDAIKIGGEFRISNTETRTNWEPEIVSLSDGSFVSCWVKIPNDPPFYYGGGILAKRLAPSALYHDLKAFALLEPSNDASLETTKPTLRWQQPSEQIVCYPWELQYKIFYDDNPEFSSPDTVRVDGDTAITLPSLQPGTTYFWKVLAKNIAGDSLWSSNTNAFFVRRDATEVEKKAASQPGQFILQQNYPNPFNPTTTISYELPNPGFVTVKVYDLTGRLVKVLLSGSQAAGAQSVTWDGTDFNGNPVAAGIYIYQIEFTGVDGKKYTFSKKMSLVK
jgi:hypothetical protein